MIIFLKIPCMGVSVSKALDKEYVELFEAHVNALFKGSNWFECALLKWRSVVVLLEEVTFDCTRKSSCVEEERMVVLWNNVNVLIYIDFVNDLGCYLGYRCAEFNIRGNSIQPHYETDCRSFTPPCPFLYKSNMAFQCMFHSLSFH